MKVSELIVELQKQNQDLPVVLEGCDCVNAAQEVEESVQSRWIIGREPGEDDDVVDFNALADAVVDTLKPSPELTIDLPKQRRLHRAFKDAVPAKLALTDSQKEGIFREWLKHEGFKVDGKHVPWREYLGIKERACTPASTQ